MATEVVINWDGIPVAKGRARSAIRKRKGGKAFVHHYTPEKTVAFEDVIRQAAAEAMEGRPPLAGAVRADVDIRFPLPKSASKATKVAVAEGRLVPHLVRPDKDNLEKALNDAMNGVAVVDDKLIFDGRVVKRYALNPGVTIWLAKYEY